MSGQALHQHTSQTIKKYLKKSFNSMNVIFMYLWVLKWYLWQIQIFPEGVIGQWCSLVFQCRRDQKQGIRKTDRRLPLPLLNYTHVMILFSLIFQIPVFVLFVGQDAPTPLEPSLTGIRFLYHSQFFHNKALNF